MSRHDSGPEKPHDGIDTLPLLGVDAQGATHRLDPTGREIYVVDDGEVEVTTSIRERGLSAWVEFVRERRGWEQLHVDERPTADWLAGALGV